VPKVNVAVGAVEDAGVAVAGSGEDGDGAASPVQEVSVKPKRTAPVLMAVRRVILLGTGFITSGLLGCLAARGRLRSAGPGFQSN
jgi:hypothetical protein